jgi:hypothetical protein
MTTLDAETLNAKALELLPAFQSELGDLSKGVSDEHLLKFLRWKPDIKRAKERFEAHLNWKQKNPGLFDDSLRIQKDPELERLLTSDVIVAPPNAVTRQGGPVLIGRLRNNDMSDGRTVIGVCRMFFYTIDRVLESPEAQLHGVTIVHDLTNFDRSKNAHLEIPKILFGGIIGHFPIRISGIYLYNAPWGFGTFFSIISKLFFPAKLRERTHFIKNLEELEAVVDRETLIPDLGGKEDFSSKEWMEQQKEREASGTLVTMTDISAPSGTK